MAAKSLEQTIIDDADIQFLSDKIASKWKELGRVLTLSEDDLKKIEANHIGKIQEMAHQVLTEWREENGSEATRVIMKNALVTVRRTDVSEQFWEKVLERCGGKECASTSSTSKLDSKVITRKALEYVATSVCEAGDGTRLAEQLGISRSDYLLGGLLLWKTNKGTQATNLVMKKALQEVFPEVENRFIGWLDKHEDTTQLIKNNKNSKSHGTKTGKKRTNNDKHAKGNAKKQKVNGSPGAPKKKSEQKPNQSKAVKKNCNFKVKILKQTISGEEEDKERPNAWKRGTYLMQEGKIRKEIKLYGPIHDEQMKLFKKSKKKTKSLTNAITNKNSLAFTNHSKIELYTEEEHKNVEYRKLSEIQKIQEYIYA